NLGNKVLVTTSFSQQTDLLGIQGIYPVDSLIRGTGQARIYPDSVTYPVQDTANYPFLQTSSVISGVVPMVKSIDAQDFYRSALTPLSGWTGDNLVAARRMTQGNVSQVFFCVELWRFNQDPNDLQLLLNQI